MPRLKSTRKPRTFLPIPDFTEAEIDRVLSKITVAGLDECWLYRGTLDRDGYGLIGFSERGEAGFRRHRNYRVIRIMVKLFTGVDPGPLVVMHSCDNPPCCNPAHLKAGSDQENVDDMAHKGRNARGEQSGVHTLTEEIVESIRERVWRGEKMLHVANDLGLSCAHVSLIVKGRLWNHTFDPSKQLSKHHGMRGERHPRRKLTDAQYLEIQGLKDSGLTHGKIAARYGVSAALICMILRGRTRRTVSALPEAERQPHCRIDEATARQIRQWGKEGVSGSQISLRVPISQTMISRILRGEAWRETI